MNMAVYVKLLAFQIRDIGESSIWKAHLRFLVLFFFFLWRWGGGGGLGWVD